MLPLQIKSEDNIHKRCVVFPDFKEDIWYKSVGKTVSGIDIDIVNRWHSVDKGKEKRPVRAMEDHYAQREYLKKPFLR